MIFCKFYCRVIFCSVWCGGPVLPTGRYFGPKNAKVALEKSQRPEKSAAEFFADLSKNGRKVAELF
jgi:hypothetical protein